MAASLDQLRRTLVGRHAALGPVLAVSSFLVDGVACDGDVILRAGAVVDVLPPFAGG